MSMQKKLRTKIAIIGYGYVGKAYHKVFPEALVYDYHKVASRSKTKEGNIGGVNVSARDITIYNPNKLKALYGDINVNLLADKKRINEEADMVIISVPTPTAADGISCDISAVEETLKWLKVPTVLIKSTVEPGTCENLQVMYPKLDIVFSPEYVGEGNYHMPFWLYPHPKNPKYHDFIILGGIPSATNKVALKFLQKNPHLRVHQTNHTTAEMIKYVENMWIATKVSFVNELYEACEALGIPFTQVREGWLLDTRVERTFSTVFPNKRGWEGKCLPKDTKALVKALEKYNYDPEFFKEVIKSNDRIREKHGFEPVGFNTNYDPYKQ